MSFALQAFSRFPRLPLLLLSAASAMAASAMSFFTGLGPAAPVESTGLAPAANLESTGLAPVANPGRAAVGKHQPHQPRQARRAPAQAKAPALGLIHPVAGPAAVIDLTEDDDPGAARPGKGQGKGLLGRGHGLKPPAWKINKSKSTKQNYLAYLQFGD